MSGGGGFQLIVFSAVMLFGSYLSGCIPLYMPLSEDKLQKVSVLGAGLLLGTALAVIIPEGLQTLLKSYKAGAAQALAATAADSHHHDETEGMDRAIGVSLVLGFIFMLLIDQCSSSYSKSASSTNDVESSANNRRHHQRNVSWTTTLGLVVHAAADGIALGAAATTNQTDVEIIVFLAIMLHKAPAAFGLVTFLLHEGLERHRTRKHLLIFSLSAPCTAVLTFFSLYYSGDDTMDTLFATGIAMLFSAGTFLYVATVHVLPEVTSLGHGHGHSGDDNTGFSKMDLLVLTVGTILPLFLSLGHHH